MRAILASTALSGCLSSPQDATPPSGDVAGAADAAADAIDLIPSGTPSTTDVFGGTGGDDYITFCPEDRFVTGLAGSYDGFGMSSVQAICSRLQVVAGEIALLDSVEGEAIVGDADAAALQPIACSDGLVAVGFEGSENDNEAVSHLQLVCAPLAWEGVAVVREATELTGEIGSRDDFAVGDGACSSGMAAAGISGRSGLLIDAFQLECFEVVARAAE